MRNATRANGTKRRIRFAGSVLSAAFALAIAAQAAAQGAAPAPKECLFPLSRIRLTGGPLQIQQDQNRRTRKHCKNRLRHGVRYSELV